ncbi:MAG: segregation/condensation protein A [Candidatus Aenigmarchaeota archaeon]|nr:segregation/condensation protein A [Candidatus Aenigmarchaeota archaeon]
MTPFAESVQIRFDDIYTSPDKVVDSERVVNLMITGSWQELLLELSGDMDSWDIDLTVLSERFMKYVRTLSRDELRIPAKILLVAAIIFRMKVDSLKGEESVVDTGDVEENDFFAVKDDINEISGEDLKGINIPPLSVPLKRTPKGKIALDDLVEALEKAMKVTVRRVDRKDFSIELKGEDLSGCIEEFYSVLNRTLAGAKVAYFSHFTRNLGSEEKLRQFASLLHLYSQERVSFRQDELFGEIYLTVSD